MPDLIQSLCLQFWTYRMKEIAIFVIFVSLVQSTRAQIEPELLVNITSATTADMITITTETAGSLVYNSDEGRIYQFDGINWNRFALEGSAIVETKTTSYQVTELDGGKVFVFDSATDTNLTIPTGLPIGFNISVYQTGDGQVTVTGSGGVTIKNRLSRFKTAGKDAGVGLISTATDTFHLTGDLKK